jgi:ABC-type lipoprotein export system ATPase subunit
MNYSLGSEWRKWDLHIHSPRSILNNGFPKQADGEPNWDPFLECLELSDLAVIGITDYFTIDGYKDILEHRRNGRMDNILCILPNVEFRLDHLIYSRRAEGAGKRLNFHVIFSDDLSPQDIEEHFLHELWFTYDGNPQDADQRRKLKSTNLIELGNRLISEHEVFRGRSALEIGCMSAVVKPEDIVKILTGDSRFRDKYLVVLPESLTNLIDWDGQDHQLRKTLLQRSDMLFTSNPNTINWCLGLPPYAGGPESFKAEFKSLKPCIHGSDAHRIDNIGYPCALRGSDNHDCQRNRDSCQMRYCWIKADPTFHGLRQVLKEPAERVLIGDEPELLRRVRSNATKYFDSISFIRRPTAEFDEIWFEGEIPFNKGLISVIGNKGSGKSALADTVGLLGNCQSEEWFSFLSEKKFRSSKQNKAKYLSATLRWSSGTSVTKTLSDHIDRTQPQRVVYIPQQRIESICNEIETGVASAFEGELKKVIFEYLHPSERLGKDSLDALIHYKSTERKRAIDILRAKLHSLNLDICKYEDKALPQYEATMRAELIQKENELSHHEQIIPSEVPKPGADGQPDTAISTTSARIEELKKKEQELSTEIASAESSLTVTAKQIAAADRLFAALRRLEQYSQDVSRECADDIEFLELAFEDLVSLTINTDTLAGIREQSAAKNETLRQSLDPNDIGGSRAKRSNVLKEIESLRIELDAPNRKYQEYLVDLDKWNERKAEICGSRVSPGTIEYLKEQLNELTGIPSKMSVLVDARQNLVGEIHIQLRSLVDDFRRLYQDVQAYVNNEMSFVEYGLLFNAGLVVENFEENFTSFINRRRQGTFMGAEEAHRRLQELIRNSDFDECNSVVEFTSAVLNDLQTDSNETPPSKRDVDSQLRQGVKRVDVYDYIFGLLYLVPKYDLLWNGKRIEQLSPGERGTLLLIFYLLVDRGDIPLLIDQPEDNLDNQTVFQVLAQAIRRTKERRQILIVTHNPNLAVACDAEQVICASLDKNNKNAIRYLSGAIENPVINKLIIDILEGTRPAFDYRDGRYL